MSYETVKLFGGAISTVIPTGFLDASTLRQIPDTQEVFVNLSNKEFSNDDSLIFDLMERVDHTTLENTEHPDDESNSLELHLNEISELNGLTKFTEESKIDNKNSSHWKLLEKKDVSVDLKNLSHTENKAYIAVAIAPSYKWGKSDQQTWLILILGIIRHKKHNTDILISLNLPKLISNELSSDQVENIIKSGDFGDKNELFSKKLKSCMSVVLASIETFSIDDETLFA